MPVLIQPTSLPVERIVDLVVVGASCAGTALAYTMARSGYSVALVEPRTYPGYEVTATLRPWIKQIPTEVPPMMQGWLSKALYQTTSDEYIVRPDVMKRGIEEVLLEVGVHLYYASQPCGLVYEEEQPCGIVIGNKSGRQVILARVLVDATEWATVARLSNAPLQQRSLPALIEARRTLEFTNVDSNLLTTNLNQTDFSELLLPASQQEPVHLYQPALTIHLGAEPRHLFLECAFPLELSSADLRGRMAMEITARHRTLNLAARLVAQHPAFKQATLAHASWELWFPAPWHLENRAQSHNLFKIESESGELMLSADAFTSSIHHNLFVLGTAAALPATGNTAFMLEPLAAAQVGTALAATVERALNQIPVPDTNRCFIRCGSPTEGPEKQHNHSITLREPESPQRGYVSERVPESAEEVPLLGDVDVLVVGGGTSGVPAATVAATSGLTTALLEFNSGLGGTGTLGGVDSYWYGRRIGFTQEIDARYLTEASRLNVPQSAVRWNIEARMQALLRWATEAGVTVFFRAVVIGALLQGKKVCGVMVATPDGLFAVRAKVVIDASGDGDVAAFAGARYVYGSTRDRLPMWYSLAQFVQPGRTRNNFTSSVDISNIHDYTRAILAGRRRDHTSYDHGTYLAPRESRHIMGEVVHTLTDQLTLRQFPDVINICFSNSDVKGKSAADWVLWGLLPPNVETEIAYRAVIPADLDGILVAGKAFSCTHDALPAIRMQADLQNLGGACAVAATLAVQQGIEPRHLDVTQIQERLVQSEVLPEEILTRTITAPEPSDEELEMLVESLSGDEPFYIDMDFDDVQREPMKLVRLCTAGPRIVPLLEEAYTAVAGKRRFLVARLLAWYGSNLGVPSLIAAIEEQLAKGQLPPRLQKIRHAGYPPDQGAMPEICYLLYTLGMARDVRVLPLLEQIVSLLEPTAENFRDRIKGTFYYVDAVCYIAERLGSPAVLPTLLALHRKEGLHGLSTTSYQADYFEERIAYLEVVIGRALARCGAPEGIHILIDYLDDARALLAEHAHDELIVVSAQDYGKDKKAWLAWLEAHSHILQPHPWLEKID